MPTLSVAVPCLQGRLPFGRTSVGPDRRPGPLRVRGPAVRARRGDHDADLRFENVLLSCGGSPSCGGGTESGQGPESPGGSGSGADCRSGAAGRSGGALTASDPAPGRKDRPRRSGRASEREGRTLRIAAHNGAPVWGGAEIALCRLLAGLRERGHHTLLYYNREVVGEPARREFGLATRRLHLGGDLALHHAVRFGRALRSFGADALIVGTFRKLLLAALGGRLGGVPRVVARIGQSTDTPRNLKYRIVFQRWVDWIVVNDHEVRKTYRNALSERRGARVVTVHKGFHAPERKAPSGAVRRELGIADEAPVIGAVARLVEEKRLDRLIRVTARLGRDVHCVVAGDGRERSALEALARAQDVAERVHFLGFRDDVGDVLDALDVLVLTSERESLANAMLEALAAGVPVVSTPVSGASEALAPLPDGRRPGFVVDGEVEALVRAVGVLLERPEERARMSEAARERARSRFSPDRMVEEWERVLQGGV